MKCENCKNYEYCLFYGTNCYEIEDEEYTQYHKKEDELKNIYNIN